MAFAVVLARVVHGLARHGERGEDRGIDLVRQAGGAADGAGSWRSSEPARRRTRIEAGYCSASSSRSATVFITFQRAYFLSSASTKVQGASGVLVFSIISTAAAW